MDYKQSGVDIDLADHFVNRIKSLVQSTYDDRTISGVGGFAALYQLDEERYLAAATDGVGSKLKLAIELNIHDTIGIDLVAMCVNDLICTGARPLFFLDYLACASLRLDVNEEIIKGIIKGCKMARVALIGGETAQMPSLYQAKDYDLAGFSVGEVYRQDLIDGSTIKEGDALIGVASSGFHSNGFSLIRNLIQVDELQLKKQCLTPTKIYVETMAELYRKCNFSVKGIAHITGSGLLNIARMNEKFNYKITTLPTRLEIPDFMNIVMDRSGLSFQKLCSTFNMGIGMVIATDNAQKILKTLEDLGEKAWIIGEIEDGHGELNYDFLCQPG